MAKTTPLPSKKPNKVVDFACFDITGVNSKVLPQSPTEPKNVDRVKRKLHSNTRQWGSDA